jgi:hypothetical protein
MALSEVQKAISDVSYLRNGFAALVLPTPGSSGPSQTYDVLVYGSTVTFNENITPARFKFLSEVSPGRHCFQLLSSFFLSSSLWLNLICSLLHTGLQVAPANSNGTIVTYESGGTTYYVAQVPILVSFSVFFLPASPTIMLGFRRLCCRVIVLFLQGGKAYVFIYSDRGDAYETYGDFESRLNKTVGGVIGILIAL